MASEQAVWKSLPWRGHITWAALTAAVGLAALILGPLISSGWFNMPPKAYELTAVKDDVGRIDKRLESVEKRLEDTSRNVSALAAAQHQTTAAIDRLSHQVDATNQKVDALIPFVLSRTVAAPSPRISPKLPPKTKPSPKAPAVTGSAW
jgi:hypothetical protein